MPRVPRLRWSSKALHLDTTDPLRAVLRGPARNARLYSAFRTPATQPAFPLPAAEAFAAPEQETAQINLPELKDYPSPREKAIYLLKVAAEVEHALLVQYLYAAYSTKADGSAETRALAATLSSVAIEEMGHLATVQNLLLALGEKPYLYRQDFGTPTGDDLRLFPFDLMLEPLSEKSLAKYIYVESPETPELPASDIPIFSKVEELAKDNPNMEPLNRVGLLYYLLGAVFGTQELIEERAQVDPWFRQVNSVAVLAAEVYGGRDKVHLTDADLANLKLDTQVTDEVWDRADRNGVDVRVHPLRNVANVREDILEALKEIGVQGEGLGASGGGMGEVERSHFYRFFVQYKQTFHVSNPPDVHPVPKAAVIPSDAITHPEAREWAQLANLRYHLLLGFLEQHLRSEDESERLFLAAWCFVEMYNLKKLGSFLVQLPLLDGGSAEEKAAALPFTMPPEDELQFAFAETEGKWPAVHAKRLTEAVEVQERLMSLPGLSDEKRLFLDYSLRTDQRKLREAQARQSGDSARTWLDHIRDILDWTVGTGDPKHSSAFTPSGNTILRRFWNQELDRFKQTKVYGQVVIKENHSAESMLVNVLKMANGSIPMPKDRKKLTSPELGDLGKRMLQDIERWIDAGATDAPLQGNATVDPSTPTQAGTGALMSGSIRNAAKDFWYDFDNQTLWNRTPEVTAALQRGYFDHGLTLDSLAEELRASHSQPDHPQPFIDRIQAGRDGLLELASIQLEIIDKHLADDDAIREAFELFGQGVLYDDRSPRPPGRRIHMMDGTPDTWVGWQRWNAFMRAAALLGNQAERWLHLNRCLGLAWAIQTEADPENDNPNNPGLPEARLSKLREVWMSLNTKQLEWAFVTHRYRAPSLDALKAASMNEGGRYAKVQRILDETVGDLNPFHAGHGRFWLLPLNEFLSLPPIYGHSLIADPGPNRGERSALVKVLKGQLPGIPQMPLNRPPLNDDAIRFIQDWIDDGCPED